MRVLGVGNCTLDQIAVVERFPESDGKVEMSTFSVQGGGTAATAVTVLARWGAEAKFVGKVGADARGRQIEKTLANEGVDTGALVREEGAISQLSIITVEQGTGRKQTFFTRGNVAPLRPEELDASLLDGVELLLVDGHFPTAQIKMMTAARERGVPVVLEASQVCPTVAELVGFCDYIVATERFASQFTGVGQLEGLCRAMLERGPHTVVVTLGDEGSVAMSARDRRLIRQLAHDVEVVDTTGAGDVFLGAFVYGVLKGWPLDRKVGVANIAASRSCTNLGARSAIPSLDQVEAILAT